MALRAGLALRDMEMVQFHPTGLLAGPETRITGTVIEEGLRGFGGYLLDGSERRFMLDYDPRADRATRDIVSRAMFIEMRKGHTSANGGFYFTMRHLDPEQVRINFKGMVERCADYGFDLVHGLVEVVPTAHYMMGGVVFTPDCKTSLTSLFAAGEDTGGVHGANRLGGNGVANSTVFGGIAGESMANFVAKEGAFREPDAVAIEAAIRRCRAPLGRSPGDIESVRERLFSLMWDDAGIVRDAVSLARAEAGLQDLDRALDGIGVAADTLAYNLTWHDWLNLKSLIQVSRAIVAAAAARRDSCGAHFRSDFPNPAAKDSAYATRVRFEASRLPVAMHDVQYTRVKPGQTLIRDSAA
jgi:fumarate reductase flavoprotein subunit